MELRVESAEGTSLPAGCYIGVRVGDVLKQGRYEPQRCYNFQQVDRRRNARIDLYQHVGSCVVTVDPDTKSMHEVNITTTDPSFMGMRLKVSVQSKGPGEAEKPPRTERIAAMKSKAKDYLSKHSIEERLSEAVKALLKEQPADPTEFLCRQIRGEAGAAVPLSPAAAAPPAPKAAAPQPGPQQPRPAAMQPFGSYYKRNFQRATMGSVYDNFPTKCPSGQPHSDIEQLRGKACNVLMQASMDGGLLKVLQEVKQEAVVVPGPKATADAPAATAAAAPCDPLPSSSPAFDTLQAPPMMVSSMYMMGPAFPTMGLQPTMLFI